MNQRKRLRRSERGGLPARRPEIVSTRSRAKPFAVDCREVPGWFCIPKVGERAIWTTYDPPDWRITSVTEMTVLRPAEVHETDGVEIDVKDIDLEPKKGWVRTEWQMFARLTEKTVDWLATSHVVEGKRRLYTFLDDEFDYDWGRRPRRLADTGRLVRKKDGSYRLRGRRSKGVWDAVGAGVFRVRIGRKTFTCLRALDIGVEEVSEEKGIFLESFVTRAGRSVLKRRYNGRMWRIRKGGPYGERPWDERFPDHQRIVINGATFVHWYDCLSNVSLGIDLRKRAANR